jgi:hypothetical protein
MGSRVSFVKPRLRTGLEKVDAKLGALGAPAQDRLNSRENWRNGALDRELGLDFPLAMSIPGRLRSPGC